MIQWPLSGSASTESSTYTHWVLSDPGCGTPLAQGPALGVPVGVAPYGSGNSVLLPLCSQTITEELEVAFPLRLELKILQLRREPWPLGDHDGGRKEAAFPVLLSPRKSFVIPFSLLCSLSFCLSACFPKIFWWWRSFLDKQKNNNHEPISPRTGTPMTWKTLWNQQHNKCHLNWQ